MPRNWFSTSALFSIFIFILSTASLVSAQNPTVVFNSLGDGQAIEIPLNVSEYGKEYVVLVELRGTSAVTANIAIAGPAGVVGKLYTKQIGPGVSINSLDLNPIRWKLTKVRYQNGDFKDQLITGEPVEDSGGLRFSCPKFFTRGQLKNILDSINQAGASITMRQLCDMLNQQFQINASTSFGEAALAPDGVTPIARGVVFKDSCSNKYRTIVQLRVNPTGLPLYEYGFGQALKITLKLAPNAAGEPIRWRYKVSDGRDAPNWILLTQAIGVAQDDAYGAVGTDSILSQTWKNGAFTQKKFKSRILFGAPHFMISKKHPADRKKRTLAVLNGDQVYSFCFPHKRVSSCTTAYAQKMKIRCGPPR